MTVFYLLSVSLKWLIVAHVSACLHETSGGSLQNSLDLDLDDCVLSSTGWTFPLKCVHQLRPTKPLWRPSEKGDRWISTNSVLLKLFSRSGATTDMGETSVTSWSRSSPGLKVMIVIIPGVISTRTFPFLNIVYVQFKWMNLKGSEWQLSDSCVAAFPLWTGVTYLDHAGATLYPASLLRDYFQDISSNVYGETTHLCQVSFSFFLSFFFCGYFFIRHLPAGVCLFPTGNPHSHNPSSTLTYDTVERVRYRWRLSLMGCRLFVCWEWNE